MDIFLGIIAVILLLFSIFGSLVFVILLLVNRKDDEKFHKLIKKLKIAGLSFVASIILLFIVGSMNGDDSDTSNSTSNAVKKTEKKPVAYSYDESQAIANKNGDFKLNIELKNGYTAKTDEDGVTLKNDDDSHVTLTGTVPKSDSHQEYAIIFTKGNDSQKEMIDIDNETAFTAYQEKQEAIEKKKKAEAEKKEKARKAAAKQKERNNALQNENKLSYGMLLKTKDRYAGEPYHITKGHVMQAMEDDGETTLLVEITDNGYGFWDDIIAVYYPGTTDAIDDDFVEIWGTLGEKFDYDTQIGGSNSVPSMKAKTIKVTGHLN